MYFKRRPSEWDEGWLMTPSRMVKVPRWTVRNADPEITSSLRHKRPAFGVDV